MEGCVADEVAVEAATRFALRDGSEFVEVIDSHTVGTFCPGTCKQSDVAGDAEVIVAIGTNNVVADDLVGETAGNHGGVSDDKAVGTPEIEVTVAHLTCCKADGKGGLQVGVLHGTALVDHGAELAHPVKCRVEHLVGIGVLDNEADGIVIIETFGLRTGGEED